MYIKIGQLHGSTMAYDGKKAWGNQFGKLETHQSLKHYSFITF